MKNRRFFLIMFMITAMLTAFISAVSAQDIDVSNMDRAELIRLLQAIMQKLENGESGSEAAEETPEAPVITESPEAENTPEPAAEPEPFHIYEIKKLTMEKIPDWYFIQPTDGDDDDDPSHPSKKKKKTPEQCENHCAYDVCPWGDLQCYWSCYYSCLGEPLPDYLKP